MEDLRFLPPIAKPKKFTPRNWSTVDPLPLSSNQTNCAGTSYDVKRDLESNVVGFFTGLSIEVWDTKDIGRLCRGGCFGQGTLSRSFPACVRGFGFTETQPSVQSKEENLALSFEEAYFLLHELRCLEVQALDESVLDEFQLLEKFTKVKRFFIAHYVAFMYFRAKNWIVKSGIKFGGDFLLYQRGPQFYHASYIVLVQPIQSNGEKFSNSVHYLENYDFQCFNRIAETTAKHLLVLEVHFPKNIDPYNPVQCIGSLDKFAVSEIFPSHHNYLAARTSHQSKS
ncbi:uncharacterized protein LOC129746337 [Uranotaenia lowii]|uniref:uncharacterized protein LOC129746337 n=1 Tax=Uranotaenia lowii TaxID=190385 RepID=UPI00247ACBB4|nr:uncharacterized protein LOC129746337 [Uranotaenia lowii]